MPNHADHSYQDRSTYPTPEQQFTTVHPTTVLGKIIQFPLTRLMLVLAFLLPINLVQVVTDEFLGGAGDWIKPVVALFATVAMYFAYCLYTWLIERRRAWELSFSGSAPEFGLGFGMGAGLMVAIVAVLAVGGYYSIESFDLSGAVLGEALVRFIPAALAEEIIFRLIIFKITEEALGSWVALVVQAGLFGLMHGVNPNATWFRSVAIMVEAGILLAAVFMYTRRIWMVFGLHLAWNFVQSTVLGLAVSGYTFESILTAKVEGPIWLTGGEFGIEASWLAV